MAAKAADGETRFAVLSTHWDHIAEAGIMRRECKSGTGRNEGARGGRVSRFRSRLRDFDKRSQSYRRQIVSARAFLTSCSETSMLLDLSPV